MNEQLILKQNQQIVRLLTEKRLKEALALLESLLYNFNDSVLRNRLEQVQTSYQYMLQYMQQGTHDPERQKLYRELLVSTWEITDQSRVALLDEVSLHYYHDLRRKNNLMPIRQDISALQRILEGFPDEMSVCRLTPGFQGLDEILSRHEEADKTLFLQTWSNSGWSQEEAEQAEALLQSELMPPNDLSLFASAVMLSLMECFDPRKVNWLLKAIRHNHTFVSQRAMVGLVLILHIYPNRILLYPEIKSQISLLGEEPEFTKQLNRIYLQLLHSQETESINRKMREEILPEMMKNVNIMRGMKFDVDDIDENDFNPDWEDAFEQSGLGDKIREMNELQIEGADVYMSTFAQLKNYPFFHDMSNWFYPFDPEHSSVIHSIGLSPEKEKSVLSVILQSGFFCNSDKYSLCFTMAQLPPNQRDMMISQMTPQDQRDLMEEKNISELASFAVRSDIVSNQYIHNLYRFFKLNRHKMEFRNIFREEIALHRNPVLETILGTNEFLTTIANFLFKKEHLEAAVEIYQILIDRKTANATIFQKAGVCYQKTTHYQEAIDAFRKADVLKPDHVWTLRHLSTTYWLMGDRNKAMEYLQRVEAILPDNRSILYKMATYLTELERYDEALKYFFKMDFIEENSPRVWRGIGWCSFAAGKHEQAMKYYDKVLAEKPYTPDYLNAGHVAWSLGNIENAVKFYKKAEQNYGNKDFFLEVFNKDRDMLLKQGIAEEDIPLMLDLI